MMVQLNNYSLALLKRRIIILTILLFSGLYHVYPSNQIEISLLTCSSGTESFTAWGHSALRVTDKNKLLDVVYNFGLFDFNTPNFYLKFIRGRLKYYLGIELTINFYNAFKAENRQIIEQKLNLTDENENKIIERLTYLYRPENRYYYYDFAKKNCTTELRDLIFGNIEIEFQNQKISKTYRDLINESLKGKQWLKLGINLILGKAVDGEIDRFKSMFLPNYLNNEIKKVAVKGEKLVISETIYNGVDQKKSSCSLLLNPAIIFSILLILIIIFKSSKIQFSIFLVIGVTGLLLLVIWLLSEHQELKNNFNLLWCNPLYLLSTILLFKETSKLQIYLAMVLQAFIIGIITIWIFKIQNWEIAFLPIVAILTLYNFRTIKRGYRLRIM